MRSTLIAGCGDVGTALGLLLAAHGQTVHGLRRRAAALPAAIRPVQADLTDPGTLTSLPSVDDIVFAATADRRHPDAYRSVYVEGLANLLDALSSCAVPPRRLVFVSSTAVYGQTDGSWVDEDSPTEPTQFSGQLMLEAERRAASGTVRAVIMRLGGIYGPGRTRLIRQVRAGEARCSEQPSYTNRIHRDDAAGAIAQVLSVSDPAPCYLGVDRDPAERCEVLRWLAAKLDVPPPAVEPGSSLRGGNKRCRSDRLAASGFTFRYPTFREGYAAILASAATTGSSAEQR